MLPTPWSRRLPAIVGLCVAVFLPMSSVLALLVPSLSSAISRSVGISWHSASAISDAFGLLFDAGLLLLLVRYWERMKFESVGLKMPSFFDVASALLFSLANFYLIALRYRLKSALPTGLGLYSQGSWLSLPHPVWLTLLIADVFEEELGARAYVIERLDSWSGSAWLAGGVSWFASLLMHIRSYGIVGGLRRAPMMLLLTALYLWRRNLPICMLAHFLMDEEMALLLRLSPTDLSRVLRTLGFPPR